MTLRSDRSLEAQLTTARMLLAQFIVQIEEFEGMNREERRTPRGRDLSARIDGLREGHKTWTDRVAELEKAIAFDIGPQRVQLSRRKGWRKPENTVVVARPSKWGNPYQIEKGGPLGYQVRGVMNPGHLLGNHRTLRDARQHVVELFEFNIVEDLPVSDLAGKNLACWCPLDQPCHADVLLELANKGAT